MSSKTSPDDDRWVGSVYISEALGVSRWTARRWLSTGVFGPVVDLSERSDGRALLRVRLVDFETYLAERSVAAS